MVEKYQEYVLKNQQVNPKQDTATFEKFLMTLLEKLADSKICPKIQKVYSAFFDIP